MNKYERFREFAENNSNLRFIETTDGMNGYPSHLMPALVGFETFKDAEDFAQEHDLDTMCFHKRDGWQLWERKNVVYEPLNITAADYGYNYSFIRKDEEEDYYDNYVKPYLSDFSSVETLLRFIEVNKEIEDRLQAAQDDEVVITYCGGYWDTIKPKCMEWGFDTHNYVIGVIDLEE